jgi:hypothetical protein
MILHVLKDGGQSARLQTCSKLAPCYNTARILEGDGLVIRLQATAMLPCTRLQDYGKVAAMLQISGVQKVSGHTKRWRPCEKIGGTLI